MSDHKSLKESLICHICKSAFEDPIILPCSKTICSKHIETTTNTFKCVICNQDHMIPLEGFIKNENLNEIIKIYDNYIHVNFLLTEKNKTAKEMCADLEELLIIGESIAQNPHEHINDYFLQLKNNLEEKKENSIQLINENYNRLKIEIEEAERMCKANIDEEMKDENSNINTSLTRLNKNISSSKEVLNNYQNLAKSSDLNKITKWNMFRKNVNKTFSHSKFILKKFRNGLLKNKNYKLDTKPLTNNAADLGKFVVSDSSMPENKLNGTIKFNIKNFKSMRENKQIESYDDDFCVIDQVRWNAKAKIVENENLEEHLTITVEPDENFSKPVYPIKIKLEFKLFNIKTNSIFKIVTTDEYVLESHKRFGLNYFCSLVDIFKLKNDVYDRENDLIKTAIDIKIIK